MKIVLVLTSITYAQKALDLLTENGIPARLVRSRSVKKIRGCGYGVKFDEKYSDEAERLIQLHNIPNLGSVEEE